ncbi:hypothetical protein GCM10022225_15970 [Plantactinospora mayteni]|uniref:PE domain-containing protein n=1 Tax=Plantactinospora mayteni TaxID=566021 RepID=A0ABQ4EG18_9ACTN|nr:hypothetical protein [Plantactinospora mayteni]GIG93671.1 hypothetical protein Pma05_02440 [Plantactinospora mayteni]
MAADEFAVDLLSLQDFQQRLQPRVEAAFAALTALTTAPGSDRPALGGFHDAQRTADRHQELHDEYVARLRRLVTALAVAQSATTQIIESYRDVDELSRTNAQQIAGAVGAVSEALHGGRRNG